jgi:hypothetical protein
MGARFLQLPIADVEHVELAALAGRVTRNDGRRPDELRPLELLPDYLEQPHGSVLSARVRRRCCAPRRSRRRPALALREGTRLAHSRVLAAAGVDRRPNGARSVAREAGRAHGRDPAADRPLDPRRTDFDALGERTLWVDCDVLQADGGTRCARSAARTSRPGARSTVSGSPRRLRARSPPSPSASSTGRRCSTSTTPRTRARRST